MDGIGQIMQKFSNSVPIVVYDEDDICGDKWNVWPLWEGARCQPTLHRTSKRPQAVPRVVFSFRNPRSRYKNDLSGSKVANIVHGQAG